jgi:hypothetical protein
MAAVAKAISHAKPASTRKLNSLFHLHLKLTVFKIKGLISANLQPLSRAHIFLAYFSTLDAAICLEYMLTN